jgi:hypothetical protein
MDKPMVEAYAQFQTAIEVLKETTDLQEFIASKHYGPMRTYLNVHELVALGVRKKVFDKAVCYHFWSSVLAGDCKASERIIEYVTSGDGAAGTYYELRQINKAWGKKLARWNRKHERKAV